MFEPKPDWGCNSLCGEFVAEMLSLAECQCRVLKLNRMRLLVLAALVPLSAPFASIPEPPEGQALIRDSYQFEGASHPMTGVTPDSGGPHKLIVVLATLGESHDDAFDFRRGDLENTVAIQGHGVVVVEYPDNQIYPFDEGRADFFFGELSASRGKMCAEWVRKATGVIAGINKLCARDDFDCSSGIALAGNSAGAGVAVQISKLYSGVNALLTTQWAPLLGAGGGGVPLPAGILEAITGSGGGPYLLPPHPLALHWCGFDDTGNNPPTWSTVGNLTSVSTDQYSPALSTFVDKTKRLSVISAQDYFGNPTADPAATAPLFSLQRDFSGYHHCPDTQHDCTQADGSGYYVVPAGVIPLMPGGNFHNSFGLAFFDDAFIGEKWHAAAALKWLGDTAFGA